MNRRDLLKSSFALAFVAPLAGNNLVQEALGPTIGNEADTSQAIAAPNLETGDTLQVRYDITDLRTDEVLMSCHLLLTITNIGSNGVQFKVSKKLEQFAPICRFDE